MTISNLTQRLLTASFLKGIGTSRLNKLSAIDGFEGFNLNEIGEEARKLAKGHERTELQSASSLCQEQLDAAVAHGFRILSVADADYPGCLRDSPDAPFFIFVKGRLPPAQQRTVAIVGAREPTKHGALISNRVTGYFAEEGWSIVSGLAIGCDTVAHQTALDKGAHTIAVLAHGLQTIKPAVNRELAEEIILKGGGLLSEFPFGQNAFSHQFVIRDKTQAGLSQGVVMIQSKLDGGSLHAARAAVRSKKWLAVPYPTEQDRAIKSPYIEANLLLADGSEDEKLKLMRCEKYDLTNIAILKSRHDYPKLLSL